ncbi:MAG: 1-acyl-sn-glycerol-3-phosphate acyltransferase [Flavobacteriales bacterium]|nr:1-acyl-sn-glycerol-3-phosphate acyltransferase [Flavobacteriales bacterium]
MKTIILIYRWFVALFVMLITGSIGLLLVLLSFGLLRNFCCKYFINYSSRFILQIMGFKGIYPDKGLFPDYPVFYTFNHNSYLDIFLLTGIGLPNIRYLLSEKTYVYVPVVLSAKTVGTRYIPEKKHRERRLRFLIKTTEFLKRKKVSMAGSAEGVHKHYHGIAPFNRGIFHMAMEAKLPVIALYIHIPKESNPFQSQHAKGGKLKLEVLKEIETKNWSLEKLDDHIDEVRKLYVNRFNALNPNDHTA